MRFSIATWNINSVRLRIDLVARFLGEQRPDVLCLQETKCPDGQFPLGAFRDLGYEHVALNGQKGYHGVAVVSRLPIAAATPRDFCAKGDSRHMQVTLGGDADGLEIHNFYVPAGGDEPDPAINDKFAHKLAFVDEMAHWFAGERIAAGRAIVVGDLNIAPLEHDVWSHKALIKVVSHTPIEVEKLGRAQAAGPWVDALRKFVPPQKNSTPGGAIARPTGTRPTRAAGSITSGSAPRSTARRSRCACCATCGAGSALPTTRRWWSSSRSDAARRRTASSLRGEPLSHVSAMDKRARSRLTGGARRELRRGSLRDEVPGVEVGAAVRRRAGGRRRRRRGLSFLSRHAGLFRLARTARPQRRNAGVARRLWRAAHFRANLDHAARTLGYLHASERLYQMEMNRRAGQGRLAEVAGPDYLSVDRFIRTLGLYRLAQNSFAALSPWAQARLQAYSDGVNAFLDSHRNALPPEFLILGDAPEPWTPADLLVWGKLMALQLSGNYAMDALRARVAETLPAAEAAWLFPAPKPDWPITTAPVARADHAESDRPLDRLGALLRLGHGASNEWIVAGSLTETGKPILANDPHLDLGAPILWYLARIVTPQGWVKGATVPGLPLVLIGQTDHIAWGLTTSDTDAEDLFVETVDPADPTRYLTPDGPQLFSTRDETIHVKGASDVTLKVRATRHGPVISDVDSGFAALAGPGKTIALAFTGLGDHDPSAEALLRINVARNWSEFLDALRPFQTPTQNFAFADVDGEIGYISPGLLPTRKSGDGSLPADGASGAGDSTARSPSNRRRRSFNPATGFIFNANNAIVTRSLCAIWPRLGGGVSRPPHSAVLRRGENQAHARQFRGDAGRRSRSSTPRTWRRS